MRMAEAFDVGELWLVLGITGHRAANAAFAANRAGIEAAIAAAFDAAAAAAFDAAAGRVRLVSPLAQGTDLLAAELALARGWDLSAPLPFGLDLNIAIQAGADDARDLRALIEGGAASPSAQAAAAAMRRVAARATLLELADRDDMVRDLTVRTIDAPDDRLAQAQLGAAMARQTAAAARIVVEQADALIAVWDGVSPGAAGGTLDTMAQALARGVPVLWIDAGDPARRRLLRLPEHLEAPSDGAEGWPALLAAVVAGFAAARGSATALHAERWPGKSPRFLGAYRWIEDRFAGDGRGPGRPGRRRTYEMPAAVATGGGAAMMAGLRALPGLEPGTAARMEAQILRRFAWADAVSTWLSEAYRGGMTLNFLLSACAIVAGVAYLPLTGGTVKWPFALVELLLLVAIVAITALGRRRRWHARWFQTRRVAEYLRHAPILLLLGVARPAGRWPAGRDSDWPERYVRGVLRETGPGHLRITPAYLHAAAEHVLAVHVRDQAAYHRAKAARLAHVHHALDRVSEASFKLAILSVAAYLAVEAAAAAHLVPHDWPHGIAKLFTFMGVLFPTVGGALAGIRYFGDFERFAAISRATAEKLALVGARLDALLADPAPPLHFDAVAALATAIDEIVVAEIESWQAVFASKTIAVPA
ncbi:hypothetical protein ASG29_15145 [Sphingomonas sp. Leaf412]|uniref:hypothetical protein n=1 Tax=Sphingomonas sp. Leaf412 TaxID=1736370 RepID=UPI0006F3A134|nr:hypothetical protein [Sphingomonas sp. Leaf412]KQT31296.1 hypothetical protein ASG29_15145 [Sphingomonas sp. Leaf412]